MTQAEALRLAAYIAGAYRNSDSSNGALAVLADQLTDLDHDRARGVVREIVAAGGPFAPSAGEIRNAYFTSVHNLPSVAAIVNEIASCRGTPVADADFSHPIIREVAIEVGYAKISEDWSFAHTEVVKTAERLHGEFLKAVNVASLTGREPALRGRMALAARGVDYYQKPPPPILPAGWTWGGWKRDAEEGWKGQAQGTTHLDWTQYVCPLLFADLNLSALPPYTGAPGGVAALPAGGSWKQPQPRAKYGMTWEHFHKDTTGRCPRPTAPTPGEQPKEAR